MAIQITRGFSPADRYLYDFKVLTTGKGWAQLDSRQDASYYGHWINPARREIFGYCEGDTILTLCDTDAELVSELERMAVWNAESGYREYRNGKTIAIDTGFSEELRCACILSGIGEHLHEPVFGESWIDCQNCKNPVRPGACSFCGHVNTSEVR